MTTYTERMALDREILEMQRARTQETTDELEDPTTERDRQREIIAEDREARIPAVNHEGIEEAVSMWQYRRYLDAVRTFMELRAKMGESPSQTLGARNGAWAHNLMDRLIEYADNPERCKRETKRLEESIRQMRSGQ